MCHTVSIMYEKGLLLTFTVTRLAEFCYDVRARIVKFDLFDYIYYMFFRSIRSCNHIISIRSIASICTVIHLEMRAVRPEVLG